MHSLAFLTGRLLVTDVELVTYLQGFPMNAVSMSTSTHYFVVTLLLEFRRDGVGVCWVISVYCVM